MTKSLAKLLILFISCSHLSWGQLPTKPHQKLRRYNKRLSLGQKSGFWAYFGGSFGTETLIGLPNMGVLGHYNFTHSKSTFKSGTSIYGGVNCSAFVLFAGAFSYGINSGVKTGPLTLDVSLSNLRITNNDGDIVSRQSSLSPKIGILLKDVWLKFGYSRIISGKNILHEDFGIPNFPMNIELSYIAEIN